MLFVDEKGIRRLALVLFIDEKGIRRLAIVLFIVGKGIRRPPLVHYNTEMHINLTLCTQNGDKTIYFVSSHISTIWVL